MPTPTIAVNGVTATLLSQFNHLHKPEIREELVQAYPEQYGLEWFTGFEWLKSTTSREQYKWQENDPFVPNPVIASVAIGVSTVTLTLGSGSYALSGAYSAGRVGEKAFLPNGLTGYVSAKDETNANAHTITLTPMGFGSDGVTAITPAQLGANLSAGMLFSINGSLFGEGSFGQTKSMVTNVTEYSNYLQNSSDDYKSTFDEMTEGTWVLFKGADGSGHYVYHKHLRDTEAMLERGILGDMFMGPGGTVAGAGVDAGKTLRATEGFYVSVDQRGSKLPYAVISKGYFENIERIFRKNYSGNKANIMCGPEWINAAQDYLIDYKKGRPDGMAGSQINTTFDWAKIGSTTYNIMPLGILKDPRYLGVASGKKFTGLAMIIPDSSTTVEGETVKGLTVMRYKSQNIGGRQTSKGRDWFTMAALGFRGDVATSTEDVREVHYKVKFGAEFHRAGEAIISHPM